MPRVNKLRTIFLYLATNGLTLPDNAQAMMLLSALPHEWEGFTSTLLTTLPAAAPAGAAAGTPFLNFSTVLPKIQEEWSHRSGRSIMLKQTNESVKREQNAQAGPSRPRCKKCSGHHNTSDHRDDYKRPNVPYQPQAGASQPKNFGSQQKKGKGKGKEKGKGGQKKKQQNAVEQTVSHIVELDSDDETDDGYDSTVADAGWSTNASVIPSGWLKPLMPERIHENPHDHPYMHSALYIRDRYDPCLDGSMYDQHGHAFDNDIDVDVYDSAYALYTESNALISVCKCFELSQNQGSHKTEKLCSKHASLTGLWLLDSGASDHSTPFKDDFLTYKKLPKPLTVKTAGTEIIYFTGVGTVCLTVTINGQKKDLYLCRVYYSPSGEKRICSLQWFTTKQQMTYSANVKITHVFDSHGQAFLEGTRLIPRSNLHWFIGKPNTQVRALGLHVNLDIKSITTVHLLTVADSTHDYDLWHARLGHPSSQVLRHVSHAASGAPDISIPSQAPLCSDCQKGKMPSRTFSPSEKRATKPLQLIHCDLLEFPTLSYHHDKWCLSIIDDYSGFGNACLLHSKADTAGTFRNWVLWAEKQTSHSLLQVRSDRGGEFMAREFRGLLTSKGVEHQLSVADHPQ